LRNSVNNKCRHSSFKEDIFSLSFSSESNSPAAESSSLARSIMTDPLSVAASITALLGLTTSLVKYINNTVNASEDKKKLLAEIRDTTLVLATLQELVKPYTQEDLLPAAGSLEALARIIASLEKTLVPLKARLNIDGRAKLKGVLAWPFHEKEVRETLAAVERHKMSLSLTLQDIQLCAHESVAVMRL
jgi:hypothetical protein